MIKLYGVIDDIINIVPINVEATTKYTYTLDGKRFSRKTFKDGKATILFDSFNAAKEYLYKSIETKIEHHTRKISLLNNKLEIINELDDGYINKNN